MEAPLQAHHLPSFPPPRPPTYTIDTIRPIVHLYTPRPPALPSPLIGMHRHLRCALHLVALAMHVLGYHI